MNKLFRIVATASPADNGKDFSSQLSSIGIEKGVRIQIFDLFFLEGGLDQTDLQEIARRLIGDAVIGEYECSSITGERVEFFLKESDRFHRIEVGFRPGVTDNIANELLRAAGRLGMDGLQRAASGKRYDLEGSLTEAELHQIARTLFANEVIHHYTLGEIRPEFIELSDQVSPPEQIDLRGLDQTGLQQLNQVRRLALDPAELEAIRMYFSHEDRPASDAELETLAQTWSEHCVHKTFDALIHCEPAPGVDPESIPADAPSKIDSLLKTYLKAATDHIDAPWVRSAFKDNAGVIAFDQDFDLSFKVETHNHPSAIEPFGGANTGVGGVVRDILGVSHRPIAATDVLCFGPADLPRQELQDGVVHPARIRDGVVAGIEDYGNKLGLPTVNGAVLYDPRYSANPLVYCGCAGIGPRGLHPTQPQPGDRIIVLGGRTGRDGLRGATFSSQTMDSTTSKVAGSAVQIGDPISEKGLLEVISRARDQQLYHAVTDCGAGGLSSAVGEMSAELGAEVDLAEVPLKYAGLEPWEIWLSEAQERMILAVPEENLPALDVLCRRYWVEWQDIGAFNVSGRLIVSYGDMAVIDLSSDFLHHGRPRRHMKAHFSAPKELEGERPITEGVSPDVNTLLLRLLAHPDIASKERIIRRYDHLVRGATVLGPLTGRCDDGPSDAAVLKPLESSGWRGFTLANGICPPLTEVDPYAMAVSAIDEAVRNAVATGADPGQIAILDNFCWGDPSRPEQLGDLIRAVQGCHDAALHFQTPFISGKDSLNNEYIGKNGQRQAIPGTLLISSIGLHPDVRQTTSMALKKAGSRLYLVGEWQPSFAGSYAEALSRQDAFDLPLNRRQLRCAPAFPTRAPGIYAALHGAISEGLVRAAHDLGDGGLGVATAEMALAGRLGLALDIGSLEDEPLAALFAETNGCLLVEVDEEHALKFETCFEGMPYRMLGLVTAEPRLIIKHSGRGFVDLEIGALLKAFAGEPF